MGAEYVDAAGIFVGFTKKTTISHNTISNVPWSGIAMGWGWGLLDKGSFPGLPNAYSGQWGMFTELTPNFENVIRNNKIYQLSEYSMGWRGHLYDRTARTFRIQRIID